MIRMIKTISKKNSFLNNIDKIKNSNTNSKDKAAEKKLIIHQLIHPDYILFDWEFFSRELEFE